MIPEAVILHRLANQVDAALTLARTEPDAARWAALEGHLTACHALVEELLQR